MLSVAYECSIQMNVLKIPVFLCLNSCRTNSSYSSGHLKNSTRCPSIDDLAAARNSLRLTGSSAG